jgi:hypothetical protein
MDRRNFLGRIAISAGGGIAASVLPASLLQAGETSARVTAACVATPLHPDRCGDWELDDICNAYPGYAYDVSRGPGACSAAMAGVADIDRMWVT